MPGRHTTSNDDRYKFTGHELDEEAGLDLSYAGARYLDSEIGSWLSIDPLADSYPGWSPYNYTMGNPVNMIDPDGRMATGCCVGVGAFNSLINSMTNLKALSGDKKAIEVVKMRTTAQLSAASLALPGPEDVAFGVFMATKTGQAIGRLGGRIGGAISGLFKKGNNVADFGSLSKTGSIDPSGIRFSQNSIKSEFQDGGSIDDLVKGLKDGSIDPSSIPSIRIVEKDGNIYTLDNRRLKAFQDAGVNVNYEKVDYNSLSKKDLRKFTTENEGVSIEVRGQ